MKHRLKIVLTVVLLFALTGVGWALFQQTGRNVTFYYEVDEVVPADIGDRRIKLSGIVEDGSVDRNPESLETAFTFTGPTRAYDVAYTGSVPDIFKGGIQVVVTGSFDGAGTFQADELMAKCPSKYEPAGSPSDFQHLEDHKGGSYEYDYRSAGDVGADSAEAVPKPE